MRIIEMATDQFYRVILAMVVAAVVACIFTIFTATAEQVETTAMQDLPNSDRIGCSTHGWPYYAAHCVRDDRLQYRLRIPMRIVTTERWSALP